MLRCVRADGSVTWQKQTDRHAPFFALHDLTHFAVESVLGFRRGFFGLVADGWDLEETTGKGSRGGLPEDAIHVESIVGTLDSERACGEVWSAKDFNHHLALHATAAGIAAPQALSDDNLNRTRSLRAKLFARWHALEPGEMLELQWRSDVVPGEPTSQSRSHT